jgi:hypothetical protein
MQSSICGSARDGPPSSTWLLLHGVFVIIVICATLRYSVAWINYKDYFPLK